MNVALWVLQILLAVGFAAAGAMKLMTPMAKLGERMAWTKTAGTAGTRCIGALEVLGAIGLILPAALHIVPILTPLAALGLALIMVGAVALHLHEHQIGEAPPALILLLLSAIVVWGRFGPYSF